jgi:hypothetical protein
MTVTGTFKYASGAARAAARVRFSPRSTPAIDAGPATLTSVPILVTLNSSGAFSQALLKGVYLVEILADARDKFYIVVPDDAGTSNLEWLMVDERYVEQLYRANWWLPAAGVNWQYASSKHQWRNQSTGLYNTMFVSGGAGAETLTFENGVAAAFDTGFAARVVNNIRCWEGWLQWYNATTGFWHNLYVQGDAGNESILVEPAGYAGASATGYVPMIGKNFRQWRNYLQLLNATTNKYHSIFTTGADGAQTVVIGSGEN